MNKVLGAVLSGLPPTAALAISSALSVYIGVVAGTLSAVCYHDLRQVKEGVSTEDLVKVFG